MSVLSREGASEAGAGDPRGLRQLTVVVVPVVKRAGMSARDGARSAATWAAPRVVGARAWTAPRIEQGGLVIRDSVGPKIYDVLVATARRVEVTAPPADAAARRRRWPQATAGMILLAAAGAVTAAVIQRRKAAGTGGAPGDAGAGDAGPQDAPGGQPQAGAGGGGEGEAGGPGGAENSRPSPAA